MKIGFDSKIYMEKQKAQILKRVEQFDNKLYLEFGGKLFDDLHAARVLKGFDPNAKINLLCELKEKVEVIFCINAGDIERNKMRADFGITYGEEVLRVIDRLREKGIYVASIVITQFLEQPQATVFRHKLENRGEKVYIHKHTKGYPNAVEIIVSEDGYGQNPYIETTRPLVVVTAPGPNSGKLGTCLSQLYHEHKRGVHAGYAKFETFPIWNLPLKHPVNVAYEAATADLNDVNMIDYFHLQAYGIQTVNYNRDIAVFPVLKSILNKITGSDIYKSPTDMGVNMAGFGIVDDKAICHSAEQEIIRRYYNAKCDNKEGKEPIKVVKTIELLMSELNITEGQRRVVKPALDRSEETKAHALAIELEDGRIVTGKKSELLSAASSMILNAIKTVAGLNDKIKLIAKEAIDPIMRLNRDVFNSKKEFLNLEQTLIALCVSAATDKKSAKAVECLLKLKGCDAHSSHILGNIDMQMLRKLGINVTSETEFATFELFDE